MARARLVSKLPLDTIRGHQGPQGPEGKPGRDGRDGRDGKNGITPVPVWEDTSLHWRIGDELFKGPDLKGPQGEKGEPGKQGSGGGGGSPPQTTGLYKIISATQDINAGINNNSIILVDTSSGDVTVTLPKAIKVKDFVYHIKKVDDSPNNVIIQPQGGETIDGEPCFEIAIQYTNIMVVSNGVEWFVL